MLSNVKNKCLKFILIYYRKDILYILISRLIIYKIIEIEENYIKEFNKIIGINFKLLILFFVVILSVSNHHLG